MENVAAPGPHSSQVLPAVVGVNGAALTAIDLVRDAESDDIDVLAIEEPEQSNLSKKRGRKLDTVWYYLTESEHLNLQTNSLCKHCKKLVKHHRKSQLVKNHLLSCKKFKVTM